uniref:5'-Nucleotidase C-terminal domain-containing protein n=1 Tax=Anopheles epiroticus TaxID=199890 RepID=A0A182PNA0_9DIPT
MKTAVALLALVGLVSFTGAQQDGPLFPLTVIHFNDLHARYNQVNLEGFTCIGQEQCQGGYPRQVSVVRQLQDEAENSIYVNAGGNFKGTLWYTVHRWEVVAAMLNALPADAMTLGRFDFFHGLEGLNPLMEASQTPILLLLTNVDNSAEPSFVNFERSVVVERSGRRIGILGVIRPDVSAVARPGNLTFIDPVEAVRTESARLAEEGVDIVVVLSYYGYENDRRMARNCGPHVDLIVGGSSNTVLFSGDRSEFPLEVEGNYPRVEFQQDGRRVLVVQAGSYGRLVGNLTLFFNEEGEVEEWEGNPVFLDNNIAEDPVTMSALEPFRMEVETLGNRTVAVAEVDMSRQDCITGECLIGSLITDSMVRAFFPVYNGIALQNRGGIRGDLQTGTVTYKQLFEVLPFENRLYSLMLRGNHIMAVLEDSVRRASVNNGTVRALNLLQVSGLRVTYRISNPPGRRVVSLEVLCQQCTGEVYEPINPFREYRVVVTDFLAEGGDGYRAFVDYGIELEQGPIDLDAFEEHVERLSPLRDEAGGRIRFSALLLSEGKMTQIKQLSVALVIVLSLVSTIGCQEDGPLFPLRIIHFNDLYARYNQVNLEGFTCIGQERCQGGYPRQVSVVRQLQDEAENSIYVNAGGNFKGTLWYTVHRWEVVAAMLNVLPADAMTLGRFDFFHGLEGLNPLMEASQTPILLTNVDNSAEPSFVNFERSVVVERSGRRIGILGVIRPDVSAVARPGNLTFIDPVEAVRTESARLAEEDVDIVVVLSYYGYENDRRMARNCGPHVDLIVGGFSNTVLFSGDRSEFPLDVDGNYPRVEFQQDGRRVLVVQAGSYGRLVGNLTLFFNEEGEIEEWEGNPVFLDSNIAEDPVTMSALEPFRMEVETLGNRTVAVSEVDMSRQDCVTGECLLGTLIINKTLGRFDFFHGLEGLNPLMEASQTPILLTNVDNSAEPSFVNFERSVVVERSGRRIGILGVIRPDVSAIGNPGNLTFTDPVEAVRTESARLAEEDVDIVVVLSYYGHNSERRMARDCGPHVDLIVGGFSNTVLFSGDRSEFPLDVDGEYPTVEFQPDGRRVLVVQAGSYGRLVGNLTLFFNEEGEIEEWEGNPVFLDSNIAEDPVTMSALEPFRMEVETLGNRTVAVSEVDMSRQDCVTGECLLGTLITDSMVRAFFPVYNGIALQNRGGIRGDLQTGTVTYKQLFEVLPFENRLYSLLLRGDHIMAVLEDSVRSATVSNGTVQAWDLLQVAGLRVTYRISNPPGRRLVSLEVLCQQCSGEMYEPINPFREYRVVVTSFLVDGGDRFSTIAREGMDLQEGPVDLDAFEEHVDRMSPLREGDGGRIRFIF